MRILHGMLYLAGAALLIGGCRPVEAPPGKTRATVPQPAASRRGFAIIFAATRPGVPLPLWEPTPALQKRLDSPVRLTEAAGKGGGAPYTMRLPRGYRAEETARSTTEPVFQIRPKERPAEGGAPLIVVRVQRIDDPQAALPRPQRVLAEEMIRRARSIGVAAVTLEKAETGRAGGGEWARVRFRAAPPGAPVTQGVLYVTVDAVRRCRIVVAATDTQPQATESLRLLEAAIQTFRVTPDQ